MTIIHPKQLLGYYNITPKKSLGQNFLFDENVLARIVDTAVLSTEDVILEIGPGLGSLTQLIAPQVKAVVAVELDDRFLPILHSQLAPFDNVTLIHGDILTQTPNLLFSEAYKVVANVPYYITGAILRHLLSAQQKPTMLVLTVQKEVAERMSAQPPKMSLLAVSTQFYGRTQQVATLKAGAFWPRPDVDSAVVQINLHPEPLLPFAEEKAFFRIVKMGFSQKRKQLQNNLRQLGMNREEVMSLLESAQVNGRRRAQTLTVEEWINIYQQLNSYNSMAARPISQ